MDDKSRELLTRIASEGHSPSAQAQSIAELAALMLDSERKTESEPEAIDATGGTEIPPV